MKKSNIRAYLSLAAAFLILASSIGLGINGISLFYVPVTADLGFSQTAFSIYYSISMYVTAVACPFAGKLFTKKENLMKPLMLAAALVTAACFFAYSRCNTLPQFYAVSVVRGICNAVLSNVAATMVVNHWFYEKRSIAVSICLMGTSAGGLLFTQLSRTFLENFTWRQSYWMLGLIGLLLNLIMLVLIEPSPQRLGLKPYGYKEGIEEDKTEQTGLTLAEAIKTPALWMVCISIFITGMAVQGTQQAVTTALQLDYGHTQTLASTVVSIFMVLLCVGKLVIGTIFDKKGLGAGMVYSCVLLVLAFACLLLSGNAAFAIAFAIIFGFGNMMGSVVPTTATTSIFGLRDYGVIYGIVSMFNSFGNATGPMLSSAIYDSTGSYKLVWVLYACFNIAATVVVITAYKLMKKRQRV